MKVSVTQFLLPNGRQLQQETDISDEYSDFYKKMESLGARLTAEILTTGMVSVTIETDDEDINIRVIPNGPQVTLAICDMLRETYGAEK